MRFNNSASALDDSRVSRIIHGDYSLSCVLLLSFYAYSTRRSETDTEWKGRLETILGYADNDWDDDDDDREARMTFQYAGQRTRRAFLVSLRCSLTDYAFKHSTTLDFLYIRIVIVRIVALNTTRLPFYLSRSMRVYVVAYWNSNCLNQIFFGIAVIMSDYRFHRSSRECWESFVWQYRYLHRYVRDLSAHVPGTPEHNGINLLFNNAWNALTNDDTAPTIISSRQRNAASHYTRKPFGNTQNQQRLIVWFVVPFENFTNKSSVIGKIASLTDHYREC